MSSSDSSDRVEVREDYWDYDDGLGPKITINCHHGGRFVLEGSKVVYSSNAVKQYTHFDPDYLSFFELERAVKELGYGGEVDHIWWVPPNKNIETGRRVLIDDADILQLCEAAVAMGQVDIYIEHAISDQIPKVSNINKGQGTGYDAKEGNVLGSEMGYDSSTESDIGCEVDVDSLDEEPNEVTDEETNESNGYSSEAISNNAQDYVADGAIDVEIGCQQEECQADVELDSSEDLTENDLPDTPLSTADEWERFDEPKRRREKVFKTTTNAYLSLMQEFVSGEEFRDKLLMYSLATGYDIKFTKRHQTKISAACSDKSCEWRVYCSVNKRTEMWVIKSLQGKHICSRTNRSKMLKIQQIADLFEGRLRKKPSFKAAEMKDDIKREYNLIVSKNMCQKAKKRALDKIRGGFKTQFSKLADYALELRTKNPGTTTDLQTRGVSPEGIACFHRFYVCFHVFKTSWKEHCRPVIGLDGCFLKWEMKGELLSAVGRDGNNHIFPIAWAIVDVENFDNWKWFVEKLKVDLDLENGSGYTMITDKQKGLLKVIEQELPQAEHRMCARHIYANWRKRFKDGLLKPLFWQVARSYNEANYKANMQKVKDINESAYVSLLETDPRTWCRAFFRTETHCADTHNNLCESFNNTIKEARRGPIFEMLEEIRRYAMDRVSRRSYVSLRRKEKFTKKAHELLDKAREDAQHCSLYSSTQREYEVIDGGIGYPVSLSKRSCDCREWDLTGIPCRHAVCAIRECNLVLDDYVSDYFLTSKWQQTYRYSLKPIRGESFWKESGERPITGPDPRTMPGRPKMHTRMRSAHESPKNKGLNKGNSNKGSTIRTGRVMTCHHCWEKGHNKVTCPRKLEAARQNPNASTRGRGRPRKHAQDGAQNGPDRPKKRGRPRKYPDVAESSHVGGEGNAQRQGTEVGECNSQRQGTEAVNEGESFILSQHPPSSQLSQSSHERWGARNIYNRKRHERIPPGYGLYHSPTNNIYFRHGPRYIEHVAGPSHSKSSNPSST